MHRRHLFFLTRLWTRGLFTALAPRNFGSLRPSVEVERNNGLRSVTVLSPWQKKKDEGLGGGAAGSGPGRSAAICPCTIGINALDFTRFQEETLMC